MSTEQQYKEAWLILKTAVENEIERVKKLWRGKAKAETIQNAFEALEAAYKNKNYEDRFKDFRQQLTSPTSDLHKSLNQHRIFGKKRQPTTALNNLGQALRNANPVADEPNDPSVIDNKSEHVEVYDDKHLSVPRAVLSRQKPIRAFTWLTLQDFFVTYDAKNPWWSRDSQIVKWAKREINSHIKNSDNMTASDQLKYLVSCIDSMRFLSASSKSYRCFAALLEYLVPGNVFLKYASPGNDLLLQPQEDLRLDLSFLENETPKFSEKESEGLSEHVIAIKEPPDTDQKIEAYFKKEYPQQLAEQAGMLSAVNLNAQGSKVSYDKPDGIMCTPPLSRSASFVGMNCVTQMTWSTVQDLIAEYKHKKSFFSMNSDFIKKLEQTVPKLNYSLMPKMQWHDKQNFLVSCMVSMQHLPFASQTYQCVAELLQEILPDVVEQKSLEAPVCLKAQFKSISETEIINYLQVQHGQAFSNLVPIMHASSVKESSSATHHSSQGNEDEQKSKSFIQHDSAYESQPLSLGQDIVFPARVEVIRNHAANHPGAVTPYMLAYGGNCYSNAKSAPGTPCVGYANAYGAFGPGVGGKRDVSSTLSHSVPQSARSKS